MNNQRILATGATGYTGGSLIQLWLERVCQVRCLRRAPQHLQGRAWQAQVSAATHELACCHASHRYGLLLCALPGQRAGFS